MKKIRIAVLDSGINRNAADSYLLNSIIGIYELIEHKNYFDVRSCGFEDLNGHGTACVTVINHVCNNVEFVIVKILDCKGTCNVEALIAALKFMTTVDVDLINMSVSLNDDAYSNEISLLVETLYKQGKFIIASKSNDRCVSIPAQLRYVYGVKKFNGQCGLDYTFNSHKKINIICDGTPMLMPRGSIIPFFGGNSKATSLMTGIIAKHMSDEPLLGSINDLIYKYSKTELHKYHPLIHQNKILDSTICNEFNYLASKKDVYNHNMDISAVLNNSMICYNLIDLANDFFHKKMTDESFNAYDFTSIDAFLTKVDNLIIKQEPQGKESYHENWNC